MSPIIDKKATFFLEPAVPHYIPSANVHWKDLNADDELFLHWIGNLAWAMDAVSALPGRSCFFLFFFSIYVHIKADGHMQKPVVLQMANWHL